MSNDFQIGVRLYISGRISNVRYVEAAPFFAKKERNGKYFRYVVDVTGPGFQERADALELKLTGSTLAYQFKDDALQENTGVWVETAPIYDEKAERDAIAPEFAQMAQIMERRGARQINPETVMDFVIEQIDITIARYEWSRNISARLEEIKSTLESCSSHAAAGAYYASVREELKRFAR